MGHPLPSDGVASYRGTFVSPVDVIAPDGEAAVGAAGGVDEQETPVTVLDRSPPSARSPLSV